MFELDLRPGRLPSADLRRVYGEHVHIALHPSCLDPIAKGHKTVLDMAGRHETIYGVNTGFGSLANQRISDSDLTELQQKLVLSHMAGFGDFLDDALVRLIMVLKINCMARGCSGVRLKVIEALLKLLDNRIYPCIPAKGSVGASGDLAPLAHMSAPLLGVGSVRVNGEVMPAGQALDRAGIEPLTLGPKEGLALLNGTQVSTALALAGLYMAEDLFSAAVVIGAMSVDAALGTDAAFDERIHRLRGHQGQIDCAEAYRRLLAGSEIRKSHLECNRVQDPYSLRCQPQVMGACLDFMRHGSSILTQEANAVTDNPLVFSDTGEILNGGNFHAEPVALAADTLALCIAEIGALLERRIALLINRHKSELPPFLVADGGLNTGYMIPQVTAAALASENKTLAHPASVDSLPTSANQEDHVSMATFAARRLGDMADNTAGILAVEYLAAVQGVDLRAPLKTSSLLQKAAGMLRERVPFYGQDRPHAPDMEEARGIIQGGAFNSFMEPGFLMSC